MSKYTYWNSESFRTLNHWQSGKREEGNISYVAPGFNGLIIDGTPYIAPYALHEEGSTLTRGWFTDDSTSVALNRTWSFYKSNKMPTLTKDTLKAVKCENIYRGQEDTGFKGIRCVWDGGQVQLVPDSQEVIYYGDFPEGKQTITPTFTFNPVEAGGDIQTWKLEAEIANNIQCDYLLQPTVQKYYMCYARIDEGYESLLPDFVQDVLTTYENTDYLLLGTLSAYNTTPDMSKGFTGTMTYIMQAVRNLLQDLFPITIPDVKVRGNVTHISTLSAIPYSYHMSCYGGFNASIESQGFQTQPTETYESVGYTTAYRYEFDASSGWDANGALVSYPGSIGGSHYYVDTPYIIPSLLANGYNYATPLVTQLKGEDGTVHGYMYLFMIGYVTEVTKTSGIILTCS